ncbi:MAG: hypothetical protein V4574_18100 [Pseudomonadota bacterium]
MQISGTLAARALSGGAWVAGRVIYVVLLAIFRRDPKALAILGAAILAIVALVWAL